MEFMAKSAAVHFESKRGLKILWACIDVSESLIISKQPLLEDPFFNFSEYNAIKKCSDRDTILDYLEKRVETLQLLR